MDNDDVIRLDDTINQLNKLLITLNGYADVTNMMASRQTALASSIGALSIKLENNGILNRSELSNIILTAMRSQFGDDDIRDKLVVFMFGEGEAPEPPPKLKLIQGGKADE